MRSIKDRCDSGRRLFGLGASCPRPHTALGVLPRKAPRSSVKPKATSAQLRSASATLPAPLRGASALPPLVGGRVASLQGRYAVAAGRSRGSLVSTLSNPSKAGFPGRGQSYPQVTNRVAAHGRQWAPRLPGFRFATVRSAHKQKGRLSAALRPRYVSVACRPTLAGLTVAAALLHRVPLAAPQTAAATPRRVLRSQRPAIPLVARMRGLTGSLCHLHKRVARIPT